MNYYVKNSGISVKRKAFTWIEALVIIGIIGLLSAILLPVFLRARENQRYRPSGSCQSKLKNISLAFNQYIQDNTKFPPANNSSSGMEIPDNWIGKIFPYAKPWLFQCPSDPNVTDKQKSSYGYNARMAGINSEIKNAAFVILNYEVTADGNNWTQSGIGPFSVTANKRHLDGANYAFADGHVKWHKPENISDLPPSKNKPTFRIQ